MKKIFLLAFTFLSVIQYFAVTYTANSGLGTWTDPSNWTPAGVPGAADDVIIPDGSTMRILGTSESCNTLFLDCNSNFSSTNTVLVLIGSSSLSITGDLKMDEDFAVTGEAIINIAATSTVTVGGNLVQNLFNNTGAKIYMTSGASTLNLSGNFNFGYGTAGTFSGGSNGSTLHLNGSAVQSIPASESTFSFCNISIANTSGSAVTIDADLTSTNFTGNLTINNGSIFSDAGFNIACAGNVSNAGTYNASGSLNIEGNYTNSGTFTSSGCNINLAGNWNNSGTYTYSSGDIVTFDGTASDQTIDGNTDWYDIVLNNTSGSGTEFTFASGSHTIRSILDIDAGAVTNSASITLLSDASGTAQMADIGSGSFVGSINMQRYFNKAAQNWVCVGAPLSGNTLNSYHDNGISPGQEFILTGYTGADYTASNWFSFINTYTYNAANVGVGGVKDDGWVAATNTSNPIGADNNFKAEFIYADAVDYNLRLAGTPNTGNTSITLAYSNSGTASESGWNLITNPYPCTVDWESVSGGLSGVNNFYSVYTESGNFAYYEGGIGGTNGATQYIPVMQGIWVQSTGGTSISFSEADKAPTQDPNFLKSSSTNQIMRVSISGVVNSFSDEALIVSGSNYSNAFDQADNDIIKWRSMDSAYAPNLATYSNDNYELAFNKINMNQSIDIPLTARPGDSANGNYTIAFTIPSDYMNGACITLEDLVDGTTTNLRNDTSYSFTSDINDPEARFIIHIDKAFDALSNQPTCSSSADGSIVLTSDDIDGYNFELVDDNGVTLDYQTAVNGSVTFDFISSGTYTINTNYVSACGQTNEVVIVEAPEDLDASFTTNTNNIDLGTNDILEVTSNSTGLNYEWQFGDGTTSTGQFASHTYTANGTYTVTLIVDNGTCSNSYSTLVTVSNSTVGLEESELDNKLNAFVSNGRIVLDVELEQLNNLEINVTNLNGQQVAWSNNNTLQSGRIDVADATIFASGVYLMQVKGDEFTRTIKLVIE